jgi:hypothetical protein
VRTTTVTCDRCGRVIEADAGMIVGLGVLKLALGEADLCRLCSQKLVEWVRGPAPEAAPGIEPDGA